MSDSDTQWSVRSTDSAQKPTRFPGATLRTVKVSKHSIAVFQAGWLNGKSFLEQLATLYFSKILKRGVLLVRFQ